MKLEELIKLDTTKGKPDKDMTDKEWQQYFSFLRLQTKPTKARRLYAHAKDSDYYGRTLWATYCDFINDVLRNIRSGKHDYCFYIYQITDLLKFEQSKLRTKWHQASKCFEVWLDE